MPIEFKPGMKVELVGWELPAIVKEVRKDGYLIVTWDELYAWHPDWWMPTENIPQGNVEKVIE